MIVNSSKIDKILYSTDVSIFDIEPKIVLKPSSIKEILKIIKYAKTRNLSINPRGSGTSAAGQSLGTGIIMDFSRNFNKILDTGYNYVDVQPGVNYGVLNKHLKKFNKFFPPDPSSADYCTIGGMVANNASGLHSYMYGATKDYVIGIEGFLSDGSFFSTITNTGLEKIKKRLLRIEQEVKDVFKYLPKTSKNSSGYNIKETYTENGPDINKLLSGSEGTLCIYTKIRLKIINRPEKKTSILALFKSFEDALSALDSTRHLPYISAIEIIDSEVINICKKNYPDLNKYFNNNTDTGILYDFHSDEELSRNFIENISSILNKWSTRIDIATNEDERKKLWWIRKAASPILNRTKTSERPLRFIEDISVPYSNIHSFYRGQKAILNNYGLSTAFFGHIGSGHFHINPKIDTSSTRLLSRLNDISDKTYELVFSLGGTIAGEHGDGKLREPALRKYQPELYGIYKKIKNIFDPCNIFSPDNITSNSSINFNLKSRYNIRPVYKLEKNLLNEIEKCYGCNRCQSFCESFKSCKEEQYKTRGRANMIRNFVTTIISYKDKKEYFRYMNSCRLCGNCFKECPSGVDIIKILSDLRNKKIIPVPFINKAEIFSYKILLRYLNYRLTKYKDQTVFIGPLYKTLTRKNGIYFPGFIFKRILFDIPAFDKTKKLIIKLDIKIDSNYRELKKLLDY